MQAVILTAGEGIRLRPYTTTRPKGMISVANKPLLEHLVEGLAAAGITKIIMVVGYHKETVMSHFGDGKDWKVTIEYASQEKPLGTGNALLAARNKLAAEEPFLVLPGDNYLSTKDLKALVAAPDDVILVTDSKQPAKYGIVKLTHGKVSGIYEKEAGDLPALISTGAYKLPYFALELVADAFVQGAHMLTEILGRAVGAGLLELATLNAGGWADAVYPWDLLAVNDLALRHIGEQKAGKLEPHVVIKGPVIIGAGTVVRAGCYLEGPLHIGEGCDIGPFTVIRSTTSIGDNVTLGSHCHIAHSIIMADAQIGSYSHLAGSVVGLGSRLGTHTSASLGEACINFRRQLHPVDEVGALIGDDCQLGNHVSLASGVVLHARVKIGDFNNIKETIEERVEVL